MTSSKFLFSVFDVTRQGEQSIRYQGNRAERIQSSTRRPSPSVSSISNRCSPVVSDSTPGPRRRRADGPDVLIIPQRVVPRLSDLRPEEVSDLFLTVQHVGRVLEQTFGSQALTISLQVSTCDPPPITHTLTALGDIALYYADAPYCSNGTTLTCLGRRRSRSIRTPRPRPYPPAKVHRL